MSGFKGQWSVTLIIPVCAHHACGVHVVPSQVGCKTITGRYSNDDLPLKRRHLHSHLLSLGMQCLLL